MQEKITLCVKQHHLDYKHCSLLLMDWRLVDSWCEYPGLAKTLSFGLQYGSLFLKSCLQWRLLHWSCATVVPLSPLSTLIEEMLLRFPERLCCHDWGRTKWCLCHYLRMFLEGSCSCSVLNPYALRCHTTSPHYAHWRHC